MTGVGTKTTVEPGRRKITWFVVRRGKIPLLLAAAIVCLRITLPTGLLVSKVLNGGDIGGSLL